MTRRVMGRMLEDLEDDFTKGANNYQVGITLAYNLVINYKKNLRQEVV
jgi:hypothetical protein